VCPPGRRRRVSGGPGGRPGSRSVPTWSLTLASPFTRGRRPGCPGRRCAVLLVRLALQLLAQQRAQLGGAAGGFGGGLVVLGQGGGGLGLVLGLDRQLQSAA